MAHTFARFFSLSYDHQTLNILTPLTRPFLRYSFTLDQDDPNFETYAGQEDDKSAQVHYYQRCAEKIQHDETRTLFVDYTHMTSYNWEDPNFMDRLQGEYVRFEPYLRQGLTTFLADQGHQITNSKWYQVGFYNMPNLHKIRDLKTISLGRIMSIKGTVTRTTEVKPELQIGAFRCTQCQQLNQGIEQQYKYTMPVRCESDRCFNKDFELEHSGSVYMDWQKVRLQELSADIPAGSMPRSIDVILRGDIVDKAKPGDCAIFSGTLVVVPDIVQLMKPGERQQTSNIDTNRMQRNEQIGASMDGFSGLQRTGVKDLSFKMVFMASSFCTSDERFGFQKTMSSEDEEKDENLNKFSRAEQNTML